MVSLGMFTARALSTAARSRGLALMSPPPEPGRDRQLLDDLGPDLRLLGVGSLLLVLDLGPPVVAGHGSYFYHRLEVTGGAAPGVAASGVRFQASARSHAVWTSRCTALPDQLAGRHADPAAVARHDRVAAHQADQLAAVGRGRRRRCAHRRARAASPRAAPDPGPAPRRSPTARPARSRRRASVSAGRSSPPLASSRRSPASDTASPPRLRSSTYSCAGSGPAGVRQHLGDRERRQRGRRLERQRRRRRDVARAIDGGDRDRRARCGRRRQRRQRDRDVERRLPRRRRALITSTPPACDHDRRGRRLVGREAARSGTGPRRRSSASGEHRRASRRAPPRRRRCRRRRPRSAAAGVGRPRADHDLAGDRRPAAGPPARRGSRRRRRTALDRRHRGDRPGAAVADPQPLRAPDHRTRRNRTTTAARFSGTSTAPATGSTSVAPAGRQRPAPRRRRPDVRSDRSPARTPRQRRTSSQQQHDVSATCGGVVGRRVAFGVAW